VFIRVSNSQILAKSSSGQLSLGLATTSHKIKGKKNALLEIAQAAESRKIYFSGANQ
jgi:hypothetical protein